MKALLKSIGVAALGPLLLVLCLGDGPLLALAAQSMFSTSTDADDDQKKRDAAYLQVLAGRQETVRGGQIDFRLYDASQRPQLSTPKPLGVSDPRIWGNPYGIGGKGYGEAVSLQPIRDADRPSLWTLMKGYPGDFQMRRFLKSKNVPLADTMLPAQLWEEYLFRNWDLSELYQKDLSSYPTSAASVPANVPVNYVGTVSPNAFTVSPLFAPRSVGDSALTKNSPAQVVPRASAASTVVSVPVVEPEVVKPKAAMVDAGSQYDLSHMPPPPAPPMEEYYKWEAKKKEENKPKGQKRIEKALNGSRVQIDPENFAKMQQQIRERANSPLKKVTQSPRKDGDKDVVPADTVVMTLEERNALKDKVYPQLTSLKSWNDRIPTLRHKMAQNADTGQAAAPLTDEQKAVLNKASSRMQNDWRKLAVSVRELSFPSSQKDFSVRDVETVLEELVVRTEALLGGKEPLSVGQIQTILEKDPSLKKWARGILEYRLTAQSGLAELLPEDKAYEAYVNVTPVSADTSSFNEDGGRVKSGVETDSIAGAKANLEKFMEQRLAQSLATTPTRKGGTGFTSSESSTPSRAASPTKELDGTSVEELATPKTPVRPSANPEDGNPTYTTIFSSSFAPNMPYALGKQVTGNDLAKYQRQGFAGKVYVGEQAALVTNTVDAQGNAVVQYHPDVVENFKASSVAFFNANEDYQIAAKKNPQLSKRYEHLRAQSLNKQWLQSMQNLERDSLIAAVRSKGVNKATLETLAEEVARYTKSALERIDLEPESIDALKKYQELIKFLAEHFDTLHTLQVPADSSPWEAALNALQTTNPEAKQQLEDFGRQVDVLTSA